MADMPTRLRGGVAAEGVAIHYNDVSACAVRAKDGDIALHITRRPQWARRALSHVPFVRGVLRVFWALGDLFGAFGQAQSMDPQQGIRGSRAARRASGLFRTTPQTISALRAAIAIPIVLALGLIGLPMLAVLLLSHVAGELPSFVINGVGCLFRLIGLIGSTFLICRLRIINRLCMYRGAVGKVLNACDAYGPDLTYEEALLSARLTDKSDGVFLLVTTMAAIVLFAFIKPRPMPLQALIRLSGVLACASIVEEVILPIENASPTGALSALRAPLTWLQRLFTREPHNRMIEVAVCAFQNARKAGERQK